MVAGKFRCPCFGTLSLADLWTGTSGIAKDNVEKNMFSDHVICLPAHTVTHILNVVKDKVAKNMFSDHVTTSFA